MYGTREAWRGHIEAGGYTHLGKLMSAEKFGSIIVTKLEYPRVLESMSDAEARADGAAAGESAAAWQKRNAKYFRAKNAVYSVVTFAYLG